MPVISEFLDESSEHFFGHLDDWSKEEVFCEWINQPESNANLAEMLQLLTLIQDNESKDSIACAWLEKPDNTVNLEAIKQLRALIDDNMRKENVVVAWVDSAADLTIMFDRFFEVVAAEMLGTNKYEVATVFRTNC